MEFPSLVNCLKGKSSEKHDSVFCFYRGFQRSVRTREHKLIVYPQAGVTQLFDLKKDPWEVHNIASDAKHAALKKSLLERLHRFQKELEDDIPAVTAS